MIIEGITGIAISAIPHKHNSLKRNNINGGYSYKITVLKEPLAEDFKNNKTIGEFYFFNSEMPNEDELVQIQNKNELLEKYNENLILQYIPSDLDLSLDGDKKNIYVLYDDNTDTRIYKKIPNAIVLKALQDGDIKWGAVIIKKFDGDDLDETNQNYILFSNSIGDWVNDDNVFIFSKTTNLKKDEEVVFKDFSFKLRDIYKYEGTENE
jgi:hypothetical protein